MRGGEENSEGSDYSEGGESDETEPVDDHGGELPVRQDLGLLVLDLHPVGDELDLLEDALQFSVAGAGLAGERASVGVVMVPNDRDRVLF